PSVRERRRLLHRDPRTGQDTSRKEPVLVRPRWQVHYGIVGPDTCRRVTHPAQIQRVAFDNPLIGIHPTYRIHASDGPLEIHHAPSLELGLKGIAGTLIDRPRRLADHLDRDRLALRFEQFKKAA